MSLVYKKAYRNNLTDLDVYINDQSEKSPDFFRMSYLPTVLTKGKNMVKLSAHPFNLLPNTEIQIDIRDSNGDPIYFEIPNFIEEDKSRIISIWIYNNIGDLNTANGDAIISLVATARIDGNGNTIPTVFKNKPNVRWQYKVNVDRGRDNITPIIFNPTSLPVISASESIETYTQIPTGSSANSISLITQTGSLSSYFYKGNTSVITIKDTSKFNSEMIGYDMILSDFTEPATPITKYRNPINNTSYTSSVSYLLSNNRIVLETPFTTEFTDQTDLIHTYDAISEASYSINYYSTQSNTQLTSSLTSFVTVGIDNLDPISGVVDRVKVFLKSVAFPDSNFELVNDIRVNYTGSLKIKTILNDRFISDPKIIKIEYLNSNGEISRTDSISDVFVYEGGNSLNSTLYPNAGPSTWITDPSASGSSGSTVIDGPSVVTTNPSGSTVIDGPDIIVSGSYGEFNVDNLLLTASVYGNVLTFVKANGTEFDLPIEAESYSLESGSVFYIVNQTSHGFAIGTPLSDSGSEYVLASNTASGELGCNGVVSHVYNVNKFKIVTKGVVDYTSSLTGDQWSYLGSTPGTIVTTEPTSAGSQLLYRNITSGQIYVDIGDFFVRTGSAVPGTAMIPDVAAGLISTVSEMGYTIIISTHYSGEIVAIGGLLQTGSLNLNVSINDVTSSQGPISITTSSYSEVVISGSNIFNIGDRLGIDISDISASAELDFVIKFNKDI